MDKFLRGDSPISDNSLLAALLSSPWWVSLMGDINIYLTTITLVLGIALAILRIHTELNKAKKEK